MGFVFDHCCVRFSFTIESENGAAFKIRMCYMCVKVTRSTVESFTRYKPNETALL